MILLNLFFFLITFVLILFSVLGYGLFSASYLRINDKNLSFGIFGLLGVFFSTLISYFTHIITPHNIYHNLLFHLIGLSFFIFFFLKNYSLYKIEIKKLLLLIILFICCLFLSKNNEDFPYYHLPYTFNLVNNKLQFGISHFNTAFRTPSSLFYLQSLFYLPYIKYYLFHSSNLIILIFCNLFFLDKFFFKKKDKQENYFIKLLSCLYFTFICLTFAGLAKFGTDRGGHIIAFVVFILILECLNNKYLLLEKSKIIIILIIYLFSIKSYFLPYLLLGLIILFLLIKNNKLSKILLDCYFIFTVTLFLFLLLFISFSNSGCLIYPLSFTCFENFYWSVSLESVNSLNHWYQLWAKAGATPTYRVGNPEEYIKYFNWVPNWINNYFLIKAPDTLGIIILIIVIFFLFLKKKRFLLKTYNKYISLYLFIFFFFLVWFFNHPDLRYGGYVLVASIFFIPFSIYLSKFYHKEKITDKFFIVITLFSILIFNAINFLRIHSEFKRNDNYKYANFPFYHIENIPFKEKVLQDNVKIFIIEGGFCWVTPSPCLTNTINAKKNYNYDFFSK
jgi:hypothetical protein